MIRVETKRLPHHQRNRVLREKIDSHSKMDVSFKMAVKRLGALPAQGECNRFAEIFLDFEADIDRLNR